MVYAIPAYKLDVLVGKIERLNKLARKNHVELITYTISPKYEKITTNSSGSSIVCEFVDLTLSHDTFKPISGYTFLASVEHSPNGNIIMNRVPDVSIPESYRVSGNTCEHCNINRYRKNTYIIYNELDQTYVQVGSTCIKEYLGFDVSLIASRFALLEELANTSNSSEILGTMVLPLKDFLLVTSGLIAKFGYVSSKKARETGMDTSTGHMAWNYLSSPAYADEIGEIKTNEQLVQDALSWLDTQDDSQDYIHNLFVVKKNGYVTRRTCNTAASLLSFYYNQVKKQAQSAARTSEWVGTVGEKYTFADLVVTSVWTIETRWGMTSIYRMHDPNGNVVVWFGKIGAVEEGKHYRVVATVKNHDTYKDIKQTVILRPKFTQSLLDPTLFTID